MKYKPSPQEWIEEFQEFLSSEEVNPPKAMSERIVSRISRDLNPKPLSVFTKLATIHTGIGTLSLLFCPYSEINVADGWGPMNFLMQWGESVCMLGCGALFLAGSVLVATFVLRAEEIQVIRRTELLQLSVLSLLSMGLFVCTNILFLSGLFWVWLLGSIFGGLFTLEVSWALRCWILRN